MGQGEIRHGSGKIGARAEDERMYGSGCSDGVGVEWCWDTSIHHMMWGAEQLELRLL